MKPFTVLCMVFLLIGCATAKRDKQAYINGYVYGYYDACKERAKDRTQSDKCDDKFNLMRSKYGVR